MSRSRARDFSYPGFLVGLAAPDVLLVEPVVPLVGPDVLSGVDDAVPIVVVGDAVLPEIVALPLALVSVLDAVVLGVVLGEAVSGVVEVVVVVDGEEAVVLGVVVLVVVLLRSQPAANVATVIAAKMGIRRFMSSPGQFVDDVT